MADKDKDLERAKRQAQAQYENIADMIERLKEAYYENNQGKEDEVKQEINESSLSVEVIHSYEILLAWGGPAVRIIGTLDEHKEPGDATLQYQDWFAKWTDYYLDDEEEEVLLEYAKNFYYGE